MLLNWSVRPRVKAFCITVQVVGMWRFMAVTFSPVSETVRPSLHYFWCISCLGSVRMTLTLTSRPENGTKWTTFFDFRFLRYKGAGVVKRNAISEWDA